MHAQHFSKLCNDRY